MADHINLMRHFFTPLCCLRLEEIFHTHLKTFWGFSVPHLVDIYAKKMRMSGSEHYVPVHITETPCLIKIFLYSAYQGFAIFTTIIFV